MPRDVRAYLADIIEACDAIVAALSDVDLETYKGSRLIRSSVEREFTIIGEAVIVLSRMAPEVFASIPQARRIVDFRNQLTHEYPNVNDTLVWGIADRDVPPLRMQCHVLMHGLEGTQGE